MARLIYSAIASLDGYIEDMDGNFDWYTPDEEVHSFINDLERSTGTYLFGRRMYETMVFWETDLPADEPQILHDYARIWQAAEKIVISSTLEAVSSRKTRIERSFDAPLVRRLKETAGQDISIGGPNLAAHAFRAGLVDECHLFLAPITVGGGKAALPPGLRLELTLLETRRFADGVVYLRYRVK
jgi:dihydrofolate reductase